MLMVGSKASTPYVGRGLTLSWFRGQSGGDNGAW